MNIYTWDISSMYVIKFTDYKIIGLKRSISECTISKDQ